MRVGEKLSHYKILSEIGRGGMGEVYLAEDITLERKVAVKMLAEECCEDSGKLQRFIQEAKMASALNHPNILTIFEFGRHDEGHYLASEYIDGRELKRVLAEDQMSLKNVLDISIQVISALKTAHEAGIVHRDIKPDNIMIREDGLVKILDFGIAKLISDSGLGDADLSSEGETPVQNDPRLTMRGLILGTPNYMSPEQARGKELDGQTDIFSFGVVLYEMLAGCLPFKGEVIGDIIASILTREPKPITEYYDDFPEDLCRIVEKCLRKEKSERYRTTADLLKDLKAVRMRLEIDEVLERNVRSEMFERAETQILRRPTTAGESGQTTTGEEAEKPNDSERDTEPTESHLGER
ncbi:MAG: serine/threonine-protein kinase [Pyrinomonadaceae bacterium]